MSRVLVRCGDCGTLNNATVNHSCWQCTAELPQSEVFA